jgi:hypothetical protein
MSSEITNKINTATSTFNDQISSLKNKIPTLPINTTDVNYKNDISVVKQV